MNTINALKSTPQIRVLAACVRGRVPLICKGQPGIGKSARAGALAERWGYFFESITGSNRDASDFLGLPHEGTFTFSNGTTQPVQASLSLDWALRMNDYAQNHPETGAFLFLDEFNTQEDSMKAMLRVLEERFAGPDKFAPNVSIVAAMNPTSIATGGIDLPAPVANRFVHMDWDFDFDHWSEGFINGFEIIEEPRLDELTVNPTDADKARIRASIVAFLKSHDDARLNCPTENIDEAAEAWPSPRMWTKAANALIYLHPSDTAAQRLLLNGSVGKAAATAFIRWSEQHDLYDPEDVLDNPSIVDWKNGRPDRLYAMTLSVAALVKSRGDADLWRKALEVFAYGSKQGRSDTAWIGARILFNSRPEGNVGIPKSVRDEFSENMKAIGLIAA